MMQITGFYQKQTLASQTCGRQIVSSDVIVISFIFLWNVECPIPWLQQQLLWNGMEWIFFARSLEWLKLVPRRHKLHHVEVLMFHLPLLASTKGDLDLWNMLNHETHVYLSVSHHFMGLRESHRPANDYTHWEAFGGRCSIGNRGDCCIVQWRIRLSSAAYWWINFVPVISSVGLMR